MKKFLLIFAKTISAILGGLTGYFLILLAIGFMALQFGPIHGLATLILLMSLIISVLVWWSERRGL